MKREGPRYSMRGLNCFRAIRSPVAAKIPAGRWIGGIGVVAAPAVIPTVIPPVAAVPAAAVVPTVFLSVLLPVLLPVPLPVPLGRA